MYQVEGTKSMNVYLNKNGKLILEGGQIVLNFPDGTTIICEWEGYDIFNPIYETWTFFRGLKPTPFERAKLSRAISLAIATS
jgi:hypothetical protein